MTQIVAIIIGPTIAKANEQLQKAASEGADLAEIRLDSFEPKEDFTRLSQMLPLILTLRRKVDGGACELEESERLAFFLRCLEKVKPAYCDIETDVDLSFFESVKAKEPKVQIIGSLHDLEKIPPLEETLDRMKKPHVAHYKLAVFTQSASDALRLLLFAKEHDNLTCIGLGEAGRLTRVLGPLFGTQFCYAPIEKEDALFGQVPLSDLHEIYRFRTLSSKTRIYGLIGHPVEKSVGHLFHNKRFPKDAVYVKIGLDVPEMPLFFSLIRKLPFAGLSITMPLKELLGRFLTSVEPDAATIGSVNTMKIEEEHWRGYNTDGKGALEALERRVKVKGKHMVVLGAGGSARAIVYEALQRGAKVTVLNRTVERREALAKEFGCASGALDELGQLSFDILINSIPVDLLFDAKEFPPKATVMDIVYWEQETPLLKLAKERGCTCISGMEMFEAQALLQQKIWFEK